MILEIRVATTIRRPRPEIAAVMFNPHYAPGWMAGVREAEVREGQPPELGASFALIGRRLPLLQEEVFEIVEHHPDLTLTLEGDSRTLGFELEGVPVGTVVWLIIQTEPAGFQRLLPHWTRSRQRRAAIRDLRQLKQFIESGEYRTWETEVRP